LLVGTTIMAGTRELVWADLRCACGSDHIMALSPGVFPDDGAMLLFEATITPDRVWCVDCWRASFVSVTGAAGAASP
jgi:hypothetical protein